MKSWKAVAGVVVVAGLFLVAGCEKKKEPPKPPPPDPLTACRNECKNTSEKMFKECSDKLTAELAFDRLTECNTQADDYSKNCRAQCDQKAAAKQG
ncbi:MAG: hypothetical protein HYZ72_03595 [Deltaproteobacteria bacterium]|nr:hypothetical protein [Deltaproteobacteria bacterium]